MLQRLLETASEAEQAMVDAQAKWILTARLEQLPPDEENQADWLKAVDPKHILTSDPSRPWNEFGIMAGRGFGKTKMGAEWLGKTAFTCPDGLPYALVAPTQNDVRFTCFEGQSGLCNVVPAECVETYSSTDLLMTLKNGATIRGFSAEKAERLRGPEHASIWYEELAAWGKDAQYTLDMATMGLRIGRYPRMVWTTTPKPTQVIRDLVRPQAGRIVVQGGTMDNRANLSDVFFKKIAVYDGTKIGRQELYGELIDPEEAGIVRRSQFRLWPAKMLLPRFDWIIMSLDTAFTEKTLDDKGDPDPSACGVWGVFNHEKRANIMLLDCWDEHLGFPELVRKVKKEAKTEYGGGQDQALITPLFGPARPRGSGRKPDMILIEDKGSGISLRQTLAMSGIMAHAYNPGNADKLARLHMVSPIFAQKRVWVPESEINPGKPRTWCEAVIGQLCSFAGEGSIRHDDHVDQTTQALRVCIDKGMLPLVVAKPDPADDDQRTPVNPYTQ